MGKQFKASTKMTAKFLVVLMVLQAVLFSLTAFGVAPTITGVAFTAGKGTQTLKVGATATLVATATTTSDATYKAVTYSLVTSGDSTYLDLNTETGEITALAPGAGKRVSVIATSVTDTTKKSTPAVITIPVPVDAVKFTKTELAVNVNKTASAAFTVTPPTAVTKTVYMKSSDDAIATVTDAGVITGKKKGTATITVTAKDNFKTDTVTVNVYNELKTAALNSTDVKGVTVYLGQKGAVKPLTLTPVVAGVTPDIADIVYGTRTLTPPIISVDAKTGEISALSVGTAQLTITVKTPASADKVITVNVTVPTPVTNVALKNGTTPLTGAMGINLGKTATLTPVVTGEDPKKLPTIKTVNWTTSDKTVATVVNGKITLNPDAAAGQTVTIAAYADDTLNSKYAAVLVTVTKELTTFSLAKTTAKLIKDGTFQVVPVIMSKGVNDPTVATVTYENDSKKITVATIDANGLITAGSEIGTATFKVTATAGDGTKKVATVTVTRGADVTELTAFAKPEQSVKVYGTLTLLPLVKPTNAGNKTVIYSSDHPEIAFVNGRTGQVTGVSVGDAIITATTFDGGKSQKVTIHVTAPDAD